MRRIDELAQGTYELEVIREGLRSDALTRHASRRDLDLAIQAGGARYRVLRVTSTSEEVLDTERETEQSPGTRFKVQVQGARAVQFQRL
jgi:hypothetical protein